MIRRSIKISLWLHSKFETSLGYMKHCLNTKEHPNQTPFSSTSRVTGIMETHPFAQQILSKYVGSILEPEDLPSLNFCLYFTELSHAGSFKVVRSG